MVDVVVDQKRSELPPVDPDAAIPDSVKKRAAAVEAFYAANGQVPTPPSDASNPSPAEAPVPQAATESPSQDDSGVSAPPPADLAPSPLEQPDQPANWEQRYKGLQRKFQDAQDTIRGMQGQMAEMGEELLNQQPTRAAPSPPFTPNYLTEQDVQNYGSDLIDFTQRAAAQYVAPHLQRVEHENEQLRRQLAREQRQRLDQAVATALPNYLEIDRSPRWHQWLRLPDMMSGRIRQQLLDEAITTANAPRVISIFNGFLAEERATGNLEPAPPSQSQVREPVVPLASLAAPGRARPASGGEASMPSDKPYYTRAQIRDLYRLHQRGAYNGRDTEWNRIEHDLFAAQREGRVRG